MDETSTIPAPAPTDSINSASAIARAKAFTPSPQRDAVITNLEAGAYTREQDLEADFANLEQLELAQRPKE